MVAMEGSDFQALSTAVDAMVERDVGPFLDLMSDDMVWEGVPHGWLWWRHTPA